MTKYPPLLVNEHAEIATGQEEVYVVVRGSGRMKIDEARRERFRRLLEDAGGDAEALARKLIEEAEQRYEADHRADEEAK